MTSITPAAERVDELLPCPFCGSKAIHQNHSARLSEYWSANSFIRCPTCKASGPSGSQDEAIAAWNRRSSGTGEAGAVAWRWRYLYPKADVDEWALTHSEVTPEQIGSTQVEIQPLYLHPAPAHDAGVTEAQASKPEINDEQEILRRLADGDEIAFSKDGDSAWFTKGDRAWVGDVIIAMREKGYLRRYYANDDDWGVDVISLEGRAALAAGPAAGEQKP